MVVTEELWSTRVVAHAYVFDVRHQLRFVTDVTHRVKLAFADAEIPYPDPAHLPLSRRDSGVQTH